MATAGTSGQNKEVFPQEKNSEKDGPVKPSGQFLIRNELLNRTHKFLAQVNTALQQLQKGLFYLGNMGI